MAHHGVVVSVERARNALPVFIAVDRGAKGEYVDYGRQGSVWDQTESRFSRIILPPVVRHFWFALSDPLQEGHALGRDGLHVLGAPSVPVGSVLARVGLQH